MKKNYYEILGVKENASREEIRSAYRELVKKYHPDKYMDNPLADLAQEKLKEINEAYDYLMNNLNNHTETEYYDQRYDYQQNGNSNFQQVRTYIRAGNYDAALDMLQSMDKNHPDWYFLNGVISLNRGWYQQASDQIQIAMRMDPGNPEYRSVWNNINQTNYYYQATARQQGHGQNELCKLCTCLYCTDCCCECSGGDFIDCC